MNKENLLSGVEDTLYIPLVARIFASEKFPNYFYDEKALSLKPYIPTNLIEKNASEYFHMASVCRQDVIDKKIIKFLEENENCNVVFLGAGLETAYNRINNKKANFYQVDLPNVIEIRKRILGNAENERLISGDMFTLEWIKEIDTELPTMIAVSGVYQYFNKEKIVEMIKKMKSLLPKGELVFDATNTKGLKIANRYVKKTGNVNAQMYFSIDNVNEFVELTDTKLIDVQGFFARALKICSNAKFITKLFMYFSDKWNRTKVIHLKLN
ncbi:MAG: class I SAM-dependent methyltransferase [Parvimonas sp.]|uniref:class I SAM-dependent methyltransferase n=1 Tax=Parvimonas sp. TaxID=1944660 RepID=UPI001CADD891|nr:class I SAM-dependent methyltransferase [Parvimonas sp.]MBF1295425.1 class I SAM-dependent methyltransferase [Parvimonas sp.]